MIRLIREDGIEILLNTRAISRVQADEQRRAVIYLGTGEVLRVKNPVYDVIQKTKAYLKGVREDRKEYNKKMGIETPESEKPERERRKRRSDRRYDRRYDRRREDREEYRDEEKDLEPEDDTEAVEGEGEGEEEENSY